MKEIRLFYAPDLPEKAELPAEEAAHAVRVLRIGEGDDLLAVDGRGHCYRCTVTEASAKKQGCCRLRVEGVETVAAQWRGKIELAVAPTKNLDRIEWFAEKATEIGFDSLVFLDCKNSERRTLKTERIGKILVSAMKQSHKATLPTLREMTKFDDFIGMPFEGQRFICHCYAPADVGLAEEPPQLKDVLASDGGAQVLIGPEGDFTIAEVRAALAAGFQSVSLGRSRLRTETAALVAVHLMNISKSI